MYTAKCLQRRHFEKVVQRFFRGYYFLMDAAVKLTCQTADTEVVVQLAPAHFGRVKILDSAGTVIAMVGPKRVWVPRGEWLYEGAVAPPEFGWVTAENVLRNTP